MQEKDKPRESPITKLSDIINVSTSDPEDARRRRLLNVMLLGVAMAALLMLVALLVAAPMGLAGAAAAVRGLGLGIALMLLGVVAIYALNRYLSGRLGAALLPASMHRLSTVRCQSSASGSTNIGSASMLPSPAQPPSTSQ